MGGAADDESSRTPEESDLLPEIARFRAIIGERLGLVLDEAKHQTLVGLLEQRSAARGVSRSAYLDGLADDRDDAELKGLAPEITIGETYFFRHFDQLSAFTELVQASIVEGRLPPRILCAGCSTGEEAYSLAILLEEAGVGVETEILGVDLNGRALEKAARGRYSPWALRDAPEELAKRWFRKEGREVVVDEAIRRSVRFEQRNLLAIDDLLFDPERFDVVFCRNVLMYFTKERARTVVDRIAGSLAPGGHLFLGHAETLRSLSAGFDLCRRSRDAFFYKKREVPLSVAPSSGGEASACLSAPEPDRDPALLTPRFCRRESEAPRSAPTPVRRGSVRPTAPPASPKS